MRAAIELDEDLRERFANAADAEQMVERSRAELDARRQHARQTGDPVDMTNVGRAVQRLSEHCRLAGRLEESLALKEEAIELWTEFGKQRARFLVRLQRALVLAELGRETATEEFVSLRAELAGDPDLQPFYCAFLDEYEARQRFWANDTEGARELLQRALEFRRENRAERIVEWTRRALDLVGG